MLDWNKKIYEDWIFIIMKDWIFVMKDWIFVMKDWIFVTKDWIFVMILVIYNMELSRALVFTDCLFVLICFLIAFRF